MMNIVGQHRSKLAERGEPFRTDTLLLDMPLLRRVVELQQDRHRAVGPLGSLHWNHIHIHRQYGSAPSRHMQTRSRSFRPSGQDLREELPKSGAIVIQYNVQDRRAGQFCSGIAELTFGTAIHVTNHPLRIDNHFCIASMVPYRPMTFFGRDCFGQNVDRFNHSKPRRDDSRPADAACQRSTFFAGEHECRLALRALRRMLGVGHACGLLRAIWNPLSGGCLFLTAIEEIHAEKENGQESQKASYDSPVTPRHDRPPLGGGKQIDATNLFASLTPRAQTVRGTAYSLSRLSID